MKGHEQLIAMRLKGRIPRSVFIDVDRNVPAWFWRDWHREDEWAFSKPVHARLLVEPSDAIARLDLRCLTGLTVQVSGDEPNRVQALSMACTVAGAKRVIAFCNGDMTDTQGDLRWHN